MANFTITAESIFESAKFQFLSGKFDVGFDVLRDSFDEEDVKDEVILSFLKGEIGVLIDGDEITFGEEFPVDEEYKEDVDSVLYEMRNLYRDKNYGLLSIVEHYSLYCDDNSSYGKNEGFLKVFSALNGKGVLNLNSFYFDENFEDDRKNEEALDRAKLLGSFICVNDTGVYILESFKGMTIKELMEDSDDINKVIDFYKTFNQN